MEVERKHYAIVLPVVAAGIAAPFSTIVAVELPQTDTIDPVPPEPIDPDGTSNVLNEIPSIPRPERLSNIAIGLFEQRDGNIPDDPRLKPSSFPSDTAQAMSSGKPSESVHSTMRNPIPSSDYGEVNREFHVSPPVITQSVARIADTAISTLMGEELTVANPNPEPTKSPISGSQVTAENQSNSNTQTPTVPASPSRLIINGIELGLEVNGGQELMIETTPQGLLVRTGNSTGSSIQSSNALDTSSSLKTSVESDVNHDSVEAKLLSASNLDEMVEYIKTVAKPAGDGLYYMPEPVLENGKPTYLFDKNTCNSERRAYPEQIAAVIAISEKYNDLVATDYPQYSNTVLDVGDFMSEVHIEHDEDNPAVDLRSRKVSSPSGANDGPAFVPNSTNYDVNFTVVLIEYIHSLNYRNTPVFKYGITKDTNDLSIKAQHLNRYYMDKEFLIYKNDHPEHFHGAFTVYDQVEEIPNSGDFGEPCAVTGADFTEAYQVTSVRTEKPTVLNAFVGESQFTSPASEVVPVQSGYDALPLQPERSVIVDDPELIDHMRQTETLAQPRNNTTDLTEDTNNSQASVTSNASHDPITNPQVIDEPATASVEAEIEPEGIQTVPEFVRLDSIQPSSELSRIINTGTITDGNHRGNEIVDGLSLYSQRILNKLNAYAPVSPYVAVELRQNNPGFSAYFPQLEQVDRQLTDLEVMARARVAHEIVFGERYGTDDYPEDKIRADVERLVAFSNRESLRYPSAVGDYKTEGKNSGSGGLVQILNWEVSIDSEVYEGVRDFDANLDPVQNLVHAFQIVDSNRLSGRSAFADWESGWKDDEGRRRDMEIYEENLGRIRQEGVYSQVESMGSTS